VILFSESLKTFTFEACKTYPDIAYAIRICIVTTTYFVCVLKMAIFELLKEIGISVVC